MKKFKLLKKGVTLFLVLFLCMENFAAIVSDNDGSAFITKAEFDSLKNDFQSQIDQYNTSIDNKIDGAIAAYLAGINIEKAQTLKTILSDWGDVTIRNYEYANQYGYPKVDFQYAWYGAGHNTEAQFETYPSAYGLATCGNGTVAPTKIKYVLLKSGSEVNYNNVNLNKFYWAGYINDYEEKISMSKLSYDDYKDIPSAFSDISLGVYDIVRLNYITNGYYNNTDLSNFWNTMWKPTIRWDGKNQAGGASGADRDPTYAGGFFNWSSTYHNENVTNKYELTWNNINQSVIVPDFNNCFYTFPDNPKNSRDVYNSISISKAGTWMKINNGGLGVNIPNSARGTREGTDMSDAGLNKSWAKVFIESHYNPSELNANIYDWARGTTSGGRYAMPTLGGIGPLLSNNIYIQKDDLTYTFKNKDYTKTVTTMNEGFPLIYATRDSKLTWECEFKDLRGSSAVTTNGEVNVILSYGEFEEGAESSTNGYVQKDGTKGTTLYAFTTSGKKAKITWTMKDDAWIYVKWFPAALAPTEAASASNWSVTLNNENSNKITWIDQS